MTHFIQFLGRLHPLIVHLPIGFLILTICFHGLVWQGRYSRFRELLPVLWFSSCISAVLACAAGYLLSLSGDYAPEALNLHMYLGLGLAVVCGFMFGLVQKNLLKSTQIIVVVLAAGLLMSTGHLGGNLTHGEDYLTQPLYALAGKAPVKIVRKPITNLNEAVVYQDLIEPILEQKCWQCHSAQKQKGALRLDAADFLTKGGKHGQIITVGNAGASDLYKRLLLPEDDDKRMPPKGKLQLTEQEIQLIAWWLEEGKADFKKKVADLPQGEKTTRVLTAFNQHPAPEVASSVSEIPAVKVAKPDPATIQNLEKLGVAFTSLTPDHVFLAANLVNSSGFLDAQVKKLLPLKEQLIWLDLSETHITDNSLADIAQFKNLTRLSIANTSVTDAGLNFLKKLPHLRSLNAYGTKITDKGLTSLQTCQNLTAIYLWQTQVTPQGVAALQQALGENTDINFGNPSENTRNL